MPQTSFKVTPSALRSSAQVIEDKTAQYEAEVNKIYTAIEQLMVQWKGQTSETFNQRLESYHNDFNEMASILRKYRDQLNSAADKYMNTDQKLAGDASKLSIGK